MKRNAAVRAQPSAQVVDFVDEVDSKTRQSLVEIPLVHDVHYARR